MAGIIGSALGDSIAKAGSAFGNYYTGLADMGFKRLMSEEQDARLDKRAEAADQRAAARAEALERLKEQLIEERAQRDAEKAVQVTERAGTIANTREAGAFDRLAASSAEAGEQGDIALSREQLQSISKGNPSIGKQYRDMGLISSNMPLTRNEQRLQNAEDEIQAARELGAGSTLLKSYQDTKRSVLDEIRLENADRVAEQRHQATLAAIGERGRQFDEKKPILQQQADAGTTRANAATTSAGAAVTSAGAAVTRANRPPSAGGAADPNRPATTADIQRQVTAAQNSLATELGVSKNDVNAELASLKRKAKTNPQAQATLDRVQPIVEELNAANRRMLDFKRVPSSTPSPAPAASAPASAPRSSNNPSTRPPLSSFSR